MDYVFKTRDGKFVSIDNESGGMPWYPDDWWSAYVWHSIDKAMEYGKHFLKENWELFEIRVEFSRADVSKYRAIEELERRIEELKKQQDVIRRNPR